MCKYTLREIKNLVSIGAAQNITNYDFNTMNEFLHARNLDKVGYSSGIYGINGGVLKDLTTGELFAITARNTALMMAF